MKGKKGGLGAFCYLAVFAMTLLALPALLWFCRRGAGEEVALPVVMYHRVCEQEEDADRYTVSAAGLEKDLEALLAAGYTPVRLSEVLSYAQAGGHAGHHDQRGTLQHAHPLAGVPVRAGALWAHRLYDHGAAFGKTEMKKGPGTNVPGPFGA